MKQDKQILIVEDHPLLGDIYKEMLEYKDFCVTWIQDGFIAQEYLLDNVPDLILLDLHLPTVNGVQLLEEITLKYQFSRSKIAVLSADALMVTEIRHRVDFAMLKPIGFQELISLCDRLLYPSA